ncbi:hypothetical protein HRW07_16795 [Streptomyces lunaelactis]|uniref:hypothetical protein n=1 Tax=Streptomyces lunaelactis TaxID=1535768 RepID=UPI001584B38D|nr:hypothetical protein [Streptomyces lunaelactis]NUL04854.1 hypothetical protein [Streptomyces lunaelactis]
MPYLVVFDSDEWSVAQDALVSSLTTDWPTASVRRRELDEGAQVRDVEWEVQREGEEVEGYTHVDGRCIYLDGAIDLVADFALWYRKLVPKEIEVIFCDDGYSFDVAVDETSTTAELVAAAEE